MIQTVPWSQVYYKFMRKLKSWPGGCSTVSLPRINNLISDLVTWNEKCFQTWHWKSPVTRPCLQSLSEWILLWGPRLEEFQVFRDTDWSFAPWSPPCGLSSGPCRCSAGWCWREPGPELEMMEDRRWACRWSCWCSRWRRWCRHWTQCRGHLSQELVCQRQKIVKMK